VARDTVLDAIEEGVVVVDDDHRVVDYDETAESLFPGLAGGRSLSAVAPDLVDGDGFATAVDRRVGDDRREFAVSATAYRGGHVLALRDVTERNAYTRRLEQQTERLESVAAAISHDLRNPLSIALGRVELVEDEHADAAADALHRMETIIDDTLALARSGQPIDDREPVSLDALARDAWETTDTGDASLGVDCDGVRLSADASRLRSCFENLFRNAVEHGSTSPASQAQQDAVEHGSTNPDPGHTDSGVTVTVGAIDGGGFYVADDGPGIPPEEREAVFDLGVSENGTGLGLAIVRRIADAHDWTATVTESETGGARFEFRPAPDAADPDTTVSPR
jgi:signal transduction histidine kinase